MQKRLSAILMAGLMSVATVATTAPASAQSMPAQLWQQQAVSAQFQTVAERRSRGHGFAAGVLGFTFGAIVGSALAAPRYHRPYYDDYYPRRSYVPRHYLPRYKHDYYYPRRGSIHITLCFDRYRSYDPRSDTYMGYDGRRRRCTLY